MLAVTVISSIAAAREAGVLFPLSYPQGGSDARRFGKLETLSANRVNVRRVAQIAAREAARLRSGGGGPSKCGAKQRQVLRSHAERRGTSASRRGGTYMLARAPPVQHQRVAAPPARCRLIRATGGRPADTPQSRATRAGLRPQTPRQKPPPRAGCRAAATHSGAPRQSSATGPLPQ